MPRWAGPPPLLLAATLLGLLIAPAVSQADEGRAPSARQVVAQPLDETSPPVQPSASRLDEARGPAAPTASAAPRAKAPQAKDSQAKAPQARARVSAPAPQQIGVATFNQYRPLTTAQAREDAMAITSRPGISIVGWQEGYDDGPVYQLLARKGWATKRSTISKSARELAVSWRRDRFALVSSSLHRLVRGVGEGEGRYPFGDRHALRVTLRERSSGELISVINTHLPQAVEDLARPGQWRPTKNSARAHRQLDRLARIWDRAPGRWVVGTGDYNVDARADARVRTPGGVARTFAGIARSSYAVLGFGDVRPTHPYSGRYVDYVHVAQSNLRKERVKILGHGTLNGLHSDHRPLLVWLKLT